jgi:hypothetical protein
MSGPTAQPAPPAAPSACPALSCPKAAAAAELAEAARAAAPPHLTDFDVAKLLHQLSADLADDPEAAHLVVLATAHLIRNGEHLCLTLPG